MKIGIPKEIMTGEARIALTPEACKSLFIAGHSIFLEKNAGNSSGYSDADYDEAGVEVVDTAAQLFEASQLIIKVKQPLADDLILLRSHHLLFSYLHLAADLSLVQDLCDIGVNAIPFESVLDELGALPLLTPMSQIAGRIATLRGASLLFRNRGGKGILLGGVDGSESGRVVVLGAGVAGSHAVAVAVALGARVDVLDLDESKLQLIALKHPSIETHRSTPEIVELLCIDADLVIGAVLLAGRRAPVVLKQSAIQQMKAGSVIVDIAIDQGGCIEGIRATSSEQLSYVENGVIHSAVPNMPATVARTASQSLSSAILPYVEILAAAGVDGLLASAGPQSFALQRAMAIKAGEVVDNILLDEIATKKAHAAA
jgi:alanine dehydrogenase